MICRLALILAVLLAGAGASAAEPSFYVGGTQVHETSNERWTQALKDTGMNTVAATVYARQGDWDGDNLWFAEEEPSVVEEIRTARERGLHTALILRVAVDHAFPRNEFIWHGMIMPRSEREIRSWFEKYARFAMLWAGICEREGVDLLAVGSELNELGETLPITRWGNLRNFYGFYWYERFSRKRARRFVGQIEARHLWVRGRDNYSRLEDYLDARFRKTVAWARQAHLRPGPHTLRRINRRRALIQELWVRLIDDVRSVYGGRLTFAANFDSYRAVGFWPQLDMIGINAYFSLRPNLEAPRTVESFSEAWLGIFDEIRAFKSRQGLEGIPIVFTELGYTFRRHSTVEPWAHSGFSVVGWKGHKRELVVWSEQPVDYSERRRAIEGLRQASLQEPGELAGLFYWKLSSDPSHAEIEPFVVHVGADSVDPLQRILADFAAAPGRGTQPSP